MLEILDQVEKEIPALLQDQQSQWGSLYINYHPPIVDRVWIKWKKEYRVFLHRIHPCKPQEPLFHPHPWPSAMKVLMGEYEMHIGYSQAEEKPPEAMKIVMGPGSRYEMTNQQTWHDVRPLEKPAITLMVIGKPWPQQKEKKNYNLKPLSNETKNEIIDIFKKHYS